MYSDSWPAWTDMRNALRTESCRSVRDPWCGIRRLFSISNQNSAVQQFQRELLEIRQVLDSPGAVADGFLLHAHAIEDGQEQVRQRRAFRVDDVSSHAEAPTV